MWPWSTIRKLKAESDDSRDKYWGLSHTHFEILAKLRREHAAEVQGLQGALVTLQNEVAIVRGREMAQKHRADTLQSENTELRNELDKLNERYEVLSEKEMRKAEEIADLWVTIDRLQNQLDAASKNDNRDAKGRFVKSPKADVIDVTGWNQ